MGRVAIEEEEKLKNIANFEFRLRVILVLSLEIVVIQHVYHIDAILIHPTKHRET